MGGERLGPEACLLPRLSVSHATPLSPHHIGVQRRGALERPAGRRRRRADYASERGRNLNPNPRPASATPIEACWQSIGSVFPPPCTRLREGNRVGQTGSQRQAAQLCPSSSACGVCVRVRERARERGSAEKKPGSKGAGERKGGEAEGQGNTNAGAGYERVGGRRVPAGSIAQVRPARQRKRGLPADACALQCTCLPASWRASRGSDRHGASSKRQQRHESKQAEEQKADSITEQRADSITEHKADSITEQRADRIGRDPPLAHRPPHAQEKLRAQQPRQRLPPLWPLSPLPPKLLPAFSLAPHPPPPLLLLCWGWWGV